MKTTQLSLVALILALMCAGCGDKSKAEEARTVSEEEPAMSSDAFWALIDEVHEKTQYDMKAKEALLTKRLQSLSAERLRGYGYHWDAAMKEAYDWRLWAAAYVIHGGCSDDGFSDFRSTVIMLGRKTFREAMRDPDTLLSAAKATRGDLRHENFGFPVTTVWQEKTGEDFLPSAFPIPLGTEPTGESWRKKTCRAWFRLSGSSTAGRRHEARRLLMHCRRYRSSVVRARGGTTQSRTSACRRPTHRG